MNPLARETLHVYLDEKWLKIVQIKTISGKPNIAGIYHKNVDSVLFENIPQEIKTGLASLRTVVRRVTIVLPSKYAITKNIEVPSLDKDEIENIIRLQAVRHTPYSKEEVIVGYINLEKILDRYTKVLLVIVSNENIRKRTDVFELAGCEIEAVHFSSDVVVKLVNEYRPFAASEMPCGLVTIESNFTDFIIVQKAKPYFIRSVPEGTEQLKIDATTTIKHLAEEFKKTCEAYQNEDQGSPIKGLLVMGMLGDARPVLLKNLKEELGFDAEVVFFENNLPFTPEGRAARDLSGPAPLLDVFADGLVRDDKTVDLLPEDLKVRKSFREKGKEIFTAAMFVIAIVALIASVFLAKIYFRNNYLKELNKSFEVKQKEAEELDAVSEETRVVKDFRQKRGIAIKVLDEFEKLLPEDMYLSEISLTDDGHVTIKGTSNLMSNVFSFVTQLENSPRFKNVTSDYTKSRKENNVDVSDFGLSVVLEEMSDHG